MRLFLQFQYTMLQNLQRVKTIIVYKIDIELSTRYLLTFGVIILKSLEYASAGSGYLVGKVRKRNLKSIVKNIFIL